MFQIINSPNRCHVVSAIIIFFLFVSTATAADFRRRAHIEAEGAISSEDDVRAEIRFGREVGARVLARERLYDNAALTRYVNLVGNVVASYSQRSDLRFHFAVLDSDAVNAYSAPGGYVFVTRGALRAMRDESELAAVLAHEIAHVELRHIVKALRIRASDTTLESGLTIFFGGGSDAAGAAFFQAADQATALLFEQGFQVQDELDSDRVATGLLAHSGYDPDALHRFLERAERDTQGTHKRRTHPASPERLTALVRAVSALDVANAGQRQQERFESYAKQL